MTNLLKDTEGPVTFAQYAVSDFWTGSIGENGHPMLTADIETLEGVPYALEFTMAANLAADVSDVMIEVTLDGAVIGTFLHEGALYAPHEIALTGTGERQELAFRIVETSAGTADLHKNALVPSYARTLDIAGEAVTVDAFAPGQAALYQVLNGQLAMFDLASSSYTDAPRSAVVNLNAIGFNVEDDLLYGLARSRGTDSRGEPVGDGDLVAIDANGAVFRIGETPFRWYIGDFDGSGNLWVFPGDLSHAVAIDVDAIGPDGTPKMTRYDLPPIAGGQGFADIAYHAATQSFYGVAHGGRNGADGRLVRLDISNVENGDDVLVSETPITGTIRPDGTVVDGIVASAFGAVMVDADGNIYVGANRGDHDLDSATPATGGFYKVVTDPTSGDHLFEVLAEAPPSTSNDGAMDTRGYDPFLGIDASSAVLLRQPVLSIAIAEDDAVHLSAAGTAKTVDLLANDVVSDGGALTVTAINGHVVAPGDRIVLANGIELLVGDDFAVTVRAPAQTVTDATDVTYTIADGTGVSDTGTLTIHVSPVDGTAGDDQMMRGFTDADGNVIDGDDGPDDVILGYGGNDKIFAYDGDDAIDGGAGNDFVRGYGGNDLIRGGAGNDILCGGAGDDTVDGGAGNDIVFVHDAGDVIADTGGIDTVKASVDFVLGDDFEHLWLRGDAVMGEGNDLDNLLAGNGADNTLTAHAGDDRILAGGGDDVVDAGAGNDRVEAGGGTDHVVGGVGNDKLRGEAGADTLVGGAGNDVLASGEGVVGAVEWLDGGGGNDVLYGGAGSQHFVFRSGDGSDVLKGFETGIDAFVFEDVDPLSVTLRDTSSGTVVTYGDGDTVRLSLGFISFDDLIFV